MCTKRLNCGTNVFILGEVSVESENGAWGEMFFNLYSYKIDKVQGTHSNTREGNTFFTCIYLQNCFIKIYLHLSEHRSKTTEKSYTMFKCACIYIYGRL